MTKWRLVVTVITLLVLLLYMASTGIGRKRENTDIESEEDIVIESERKKENIVIESERKEENIEEESKKNEEKVRRWASMALCWGGRCL